jgi:DNA-binding MarR family transcriptional regulator
MAQLLSRMERDGLIRRERDPADRRSSLISLTEQARARLPAGREILVKGNQDMMRGLSDEEISTLTSLLQRVLANIEALEA